MGPVQKSVATLRISGDDVIPAELTKLLGHAPSAAQEKGELIRRTGAERIARIGMWRLISAEREPEELDEQIGELLNKLTDDMEVWRDLAGKYRIDLFCGLFMGSGNEGLSVSLSSLLALGQRGIELALDIYASES